MLTIGIIAIPYRQPDVFCADAADPSPTGLSCDPRLERLGRRAAARRQDLRGHDRAGRGLALGLQIVGASRAGVPMTGRAANLDAAKAAFKASYDGYQAWSVTGAWKHKADDAVSAEIVRWDGGRVGVSYTFADGAREAHAVGTDDWPIIRNAGKLTYADDEVRAGMDEIAKREGWTAEDRITSYEIGDSNVARAVAAAQRRYRDPGTRAGLGFEISVIRLSNRYRVSAWLGGFASLRASPYRWHRQTRP